MNKPASFSLGVPATRGSPCSIWSSIASSARFPVGGGPDSVAYDAGLHRIYVTGRAGDLCVIMRDSNGAIATLDKIPLHYGAHTLAVDPESHRLYVGYASLVIAPRIAVFSPLGAAKERFASTPSSSVIMLSRAVRKMVED